MGQPSGFSVADPDTEANIPLLIKVAIIFIQLYTLFEKKKSDINHIPQFVFFIQFLSFTPLAIFPSKPCTPSSLIKKIYIYTLDFNSARRTKESQSGANRYRIRNTSPSKILTVKESTVFYVNAVCYPPTGNRCKWFYQKSQYLAIKPLLLDKNKRKVRYHFLYMVI